MCYGQAVQEEEPDGKGQSHDFMASRLSIPPVIDQIVLYHSLEGRPPILMVKDSYTVTPKALCECAVADTCLIARPNKRHTSHYPG